MNRYRYSIVLALTVLVTSSVTSGGVSAQEASPAAGTPFPEPTACTAEPLDIDSMLALWFDPAGTPMATPAIATPLSGDADLPQGTRADVATEVAITETTLNWIYCIEVAGEYARGFSYLTDNLLAQFGPDVTNPGQDTPEEVRAALEGQLIGTPIPGDITLARMPAMAGPRRIRLLDDGRVSALWSFSGDRVVFIYALQDDRWLIDEAIDLIDMQGTPTAGTPAAATPAP